jgi:PhzF family phenazine biosynthesis protein
MKIPIYQVDAFASSLFKGNPAAVCPLEEWLDDEILQNIALENNLSETAFFVDEPTGLHLRWFTPGAEVDLCGHATLATGHVLFDEMGLEDGAIDFKSRSGTLTVTKSGDQLILDFPADQPTQVSHADHIGEALGATSYLVYKGKTDYLVILENEAAVASLRPDFKALIELDVRGVIASAPGDSVDFVSRFFAPVVGVDEDPVTGSAHTLMTPYWAKRLGKTKMSARQISSRVGELGVELTGDRVKISGKAVTYLRGIIEI